MSPDRAPSTASPTLWLVAEAPAPPEVVEVRGIRVTVATVTLDGDAADVARRAVPLAGAALLLGLRRGTGGAPL